ncbi:MAG TPA: hypothetical protein VG873_18370 [Burkholderiales bacterium]|nr:hypothetical protein [Burkholderiales bacterium]
MSATIAGIRTNVLEGERRGRPPAPGARRKALELQLSSFYAIAYELAGAIEELSPESRERLAQVAGGLEALARGGRS